MKYIGLYYHLRFRPSASKLTGRCFTVQKNSDPKHTATDLFNAKNWNVLQWPSQSADLRPVEHAFHSVKAKLKVKPLKKQAGTEGQSEHHHGRNHNW